MSHRTAVTYHRVSTVDQNPKLARGELRAAARARRLRIIAEIEEHASGARNDRPGFQRLMKLARAGRVDYVLVWKLDRLGRSCVDVLTNIKALKQAGVTFVATSQGLEVGPRGEVVGDLILAVMAAMAEFERSIISERTLLGLAAARRKGVRLGRPRKTPRLCTGHGGPFEVGTLCDRCIDERLAARREGRRQKRDPRIRPSD